MDSIHELPLRSATDWFLIVERRDAKQRTSERNKRGATCIHRERRYHQYRCARRRRNGRALHSPGRHEHSPARSRLEGLPTGQAGCRRNAARRFPFGCGRFRALERSKQVCRRTSPRENLGQPRLCTRLGSGSRDHQVELIVGISGRDVANEVSLAVQFDKRHAVPFAAYVMDRIDRDPSVRNNPGGFVEPLYE